MGMLELSWEVSKVGKTVEEGGGKNRGPERSKLVPVVFVVGGVKVDDEETVQIFNRGRKKLLCSAFPPFLLQLRAII